MTKKSAIFYLCLSICLQISWNGYSQENEVKTIPSFTLQQAIQHALLHNKKIKNATLSIQAAEKQKWETIADGLPQINASLTYSNSFSRPNDIANDPNVSFFFPKHKASPTITLTQLLFDGAYIVGLQSSKVFLEISKNSKIKTDKEIEKAVVSAYNNALLTKESILILKKNIISLSKSFEETKALYNNGFVEEEEVEQLELTLNDLENNLENLNNFESISKNYLKLLIGIDSVEKIIISDTLSFLSDEITLDNSKDQEISFLKNIDYIIAENSTESKRLLYKLEIARRLPTLTSYINAGYFGQSSSITNDEFRFFKNDQPWFGTASFGLQLDIPIFSSFKSSSRTKRAKINWDISLNTLAETRQEIEIAIDKTKSEFDLAINTLLNKKRNLNLAERIERKNTIKYKEGIATSFELRQAQIQLYSIQQEYLQAMVNVINKKAELKALEE